MPSVWRVDFQQILSEIITRLYTLAKQKTHPRGRHGLQESEKLFLSGDTGWKILPTVWEENPDDLILGSRGGGGGNRTERCVFFTGAARTLINSHNGKGKVSSNMGVKI